MKTGVFDKNPYLCRWKHDFFGFFTMRKVVTNKDIKQALNLKGFPGTCVAGMAYGALRLGKINRLFDGAADYQGREW